MILYLMLNVHPIQLHLWLFNKLIISRLLQTCNQHKTDDIYLLVSLISLVFHHST